jgi:hypothetical protein
MYGLMAVSAAVLFGEPLLKTAMAKLAEVSTSRTAVRTLRTAVAAEDPAQPTDQLREQAFHAAESLVAYYTATGDTAAADAARDAGRLLFGPDRQTAAKPAAAPKVGPRKRGG